MKGGVKLTLTDEQFGQIMNRFRQNTQLPIPSQKRGICATDALSAVMWYADEIRPLLWEIVKGGIDSPCDTKFLTLSTTQLVLCWLKTTGARVATILQRSLPPAPVQLSTPGVTPLMLQALAFRPGLSTSFKRQESAKAEELEMTVPEGADVGEFCSMVYHAYRIRLLDELRRQELDTSVLESIPKKTEFGAQIDVIPSLINSAFQLLGADNEYECGPALPFLATPLAIYLNVNTDIPNRDHAVALCKIQGQWQFLDDNVGYSLPLLSEYNADVTVVKNKLTVTLSERGTFLAIGPVAITLSGKKQIPNEQVSTTRTWPESTRFYLYRKSKVTQETVASMVGYGLTEDDAIPALLASNNDIDAAFEWLRINNPLALGPPEGVNPEYYTRLVNTFGKSRRSDIINALRDTNNDYDKAEGDLLYSGGGRIKKHTRHIMKGGVKRFAGADTCVYVPPVKCNDESRPRNENRYVSRIKTKAEARADILIESRINQFFPELVANGSVTVHEKVCTPDFQIQDLAPPHPDSQSRGCDQVRPTGVGPNTNYKNLITPRRGSTLSALRRAGGNLAQIIQGALIATIGLVPDGGPWIIHIDAHLGNIFYYDENGERKSSLADWGRYFFIENPNDYTNVRSALSLIIANSATRHYFDFDDDRYPQLPSESRNLIRGLYRTTDPAQQQRVVNALRGFTTHAIIGQVFGTKYPDLLTCTNQAQLLRRVNRHTGLNLVIPPHGVPPPPTPVAPPARAPTPVPTAAYPDTILHVSDNRTSYGRFEPLTTHAGNQYGQILYSDGSLDLTVSPIRATLPVLRIVNQNTRVNQLVSNARVNEPRVGINFAHVVFIDNQTALMFKQTADGFRFTFAIRDQASPIMIEWGGDYFPVRIQEQPPQAPVAQQGIAAQGLPRRRVAPLGQQAPVAMEDVEPARQALGIMGPQVGPRRVDPRQLQQALGIMGPQVGPRQAPVAMEDAELQGILTTSSGSRAVTIQTLNATDYRVTYNGTARSVRRVQGGNSTTTLQIGQGAPFPVNFIETGVMNALLQGVYVPPAPRRGGRSTRRRKNQRAKKTRKH